MAGCLLGGSDVHRTHNECVLCVFVSLPFESLKLTPQEWDRGAEEDPRFPLHPAFPALRSGSCCSFCLPGCPLGPSDLTS